jgi:hypothetical protein
MRNTYHYFFHAGEINAVRQQLGHPEIPFIGLMQGTWSFRCNRHYDADITHSRHRTSYTRTGSSMSGLVPLLRAGFSNFVMPTPIT